MILVLKLEPERILKRQSLVFIIGVSLYVIYIHDMLADGTCMSCMYQNCIFFPMILQKNRILVTDMGLLKEVEKISASGVTLQF